MGSALHRLWLARLGLRIPHAASLGAGGMCFRSRYVSRERGSGERYRDADSNNCCNYLIHDYSSLCLPETRQRLRRIVLRHAQALRCSDAVTE